MAWRLIGRVGDSRQRGRCRDRREDQSARRAGSGAQHADSGSQGWHRQRVCGDAEADHRGCAVAINGRPTLTTADGAFSASLRSLGAIRHRLLRPGGAARAPAAVQRFRLPPRPARDRRRCARIGNPARLRLGRCGVEGASISAAYVQYDGLNPVCLRLGAFPPYATWKTVKAPPTCCSSSVRPSSRDSAWSRRRATVVGISVVRARVSASSDRWR